MIIPTKLSDLIPEEPEFYIETLGRSIAIRPPNMMDKVWLDARYPEDRLKTVMGKLDWLEIAKIVYHQLSQEDRAAFPSQTAKGFNDDGDEVMIQVTGPEALIISMSGLKETTGMLNALTRAFMISNPEIVPMIEEEVKKKLVELNQKFGEKDLSPQITPKSSTRSTTRTGGGKKK